METLFTGQFSDHQNRHCQHSVKYMAEQRLTEGIQQKLMLKLLEFDYSIEYKKGKGNLAVDALSRRDTDSDNRQLQCSAITTVQPEWVADVKASYVGDALYTQILNRIQQNTEPTCPYILQGGFLGVQEQNTCRTNK